MLNIDTIKVTPEILVLLSEIDEFRGAWRALGTLAPERLRALRHVATIESIGLSTRIEGSRLSDRDVERLLANLDIQRFNTRDGQEVAGYADVMETINRAWAGIPITENRIKQYTGIFCAIVKRMSAIAGNIRPCATTSVRLMQAGR